MSHKSLLVFASVLCSDEDSDEITLAAALFIVCFCNKVTISYLLHCVLAPVRPIQITFCMYSLFRCIGRCACGSAELAKIDRRAAAAQWLLQHAPEHRSAPTFSDVWW